MNSSKSTPHWLKALGKSDLPESIYVQNIFYRYQRTYKSDFFAITAMYEQVEQKNQPDLNHTSSGYNKVILKINRRAPLFFIPLNWIGMILAWQEKRCLRKLADVDGVPVFIESFGKTGIIREYIDGHAMKKKEHVPDDFHANLCQLVDQMHNRKLAYVDLEKCENVLVGDDGKPWLFDFQISWYCSDKWGGNLFPLSLIRKHLQKSDQYHLLKLQRRTRPDQMSQELLDLSYRKPWYIRWHGTLTRPFQRIRRRLLKRFDPGDYSGERGRVTG